MKTEHAIREAVALVIVSISHTAPARLTKLVNRELGWSNEDRKAELQEPPGSAAASLIGLSERWSRALRKLATPTNSCKCPTSSCKLSMRLTFETQNKIPTFSPAAAGWKNQTDFLSVGFFCPLEKTILALPPEGFRFFSLPEKLA